MCSVYLGRGGRSVGGGGGDGAVWLSPVRVVRVLGGGGVGVAHELRQGVDWDREDDGAVILGRDAVQCLKIPQLQMDKCQMLDHSASCL